MSSIMNQVTSYVHTVKTYFYLIDRESMMRNTIRTAVRLQCVFLLAIYMFAVNLTVRPIVWHTP